MTKNILTKSFEYINFVTADYGCLRIVGLQQNFTMTINQLYSLWT